jgi:hypothetical protein
VIAAVIVVLDEASDVSFEIAGLIVFFQQDAVLQSLMRALYHALGLRMLLGEKDASKAALTKALETFSSDAAAKTRLSAAARKLGVGSN